MREKPWRSYFGILLLIFLGGVFLRMNLVDSLLFFPDKAWEAQPEDYGMKAEEVWIQLDSGEKLNALWIGRQEKDKHVLFLHGNAGNLSHRLHRFAAWKDLPCSFFILDYRGFGKSHGKASESQLQEDAAAAYSYMIQQKGIDSTNLFLFGESIGGAVATELATVKTVAGLILESTFTNLQNLARIHYPFLPTILAKGIFPTDRQITEVDVPILIAHGTEDEIVPFEMGQDLSRLASDKAKFLPIQGAGHNDVYLAGGQTYKESLENFFQNSSEDSLRPEKRMKSE